MKAFSSRDLMVTVLPERAEHADLFMACQATVCTTTCTDTVSTMSKPKYDAEAEYGALREQLETVLTA